ncbi:MAG: inorganic phosphate transporter [Salana multivorans]|uniref:inorganic phosphate transporter n=1 Tax=Salana multivorans TaxID=120377 RepID=UPI00095B2300|nr:inorganic phosphate transporter [Salana multivorans]MBN8880819.1 inorganic phosphate transporter [Salana multivorans]OJX97686.1 MAG: anion permease [Micrococcales bacterium 73-15]
MEAALVVVIVAVALAFAWTNGVHDASNAIATSVSTRALTPRAALVMAAVMNVVGALLGTSVAETIATRIVTLAPPGADPGTVPEGMAGAALVVVLAALVGAIGWNLLTWRLGMPSSSSYALIGGLVGAGLAGAYAIQWGEVMDRVVWPLLLSPVIGFTLAFVLMTALLWAIRGARPAPTTRRFRAAQTVSAAAMALGHGLQDAQKTMGVILLALLTVGWAAPGSSVPLWVKLCSAAAISLGTYAGGWRIIRTLGRRLIHLDPARGFVAESVAASVLYVAAMGLHAPVSTTQTITSAIAGTGATRGLAAVRWGVLRSIALTWAATIPAAGLLGALAFWLLRAVLPV